MIFEENKKIEFSGKIMGYISAYFLSTTFLFFILYLSGNLPSSWSYLHVMILVFLIALIGVIIKRSLK